MAAETLVINVDLSRWSYGAGPSRWQPAYVPFAIFGWFGVLALLGVAGAVSLALVLGGLSIVVIVASFVATIFQRVKSSTVGTPLPTVRPSNAGERIAPFDRTLGEIGREIDALDPTAPATVAPAAEDDRRRRNIFFAVGGALIAAAAGLVVLAVRIRGPAWVIIAAVLLIAGLYVAFVLSRRAPRPRDGRPPVSRSRRIRSMLYIAGGLLIVAAGFPLVIAMRLGGALQLPAMMLLMVGMYAMFTRSRRVLQQSADVALAVDPRAPILYLRSFRDDKTAAASRGDFFGLRIWQVLRLEEAISRTISKLGPFLAVGEPHEGLPQLGAARAYLDENEWQKAVLAWIKTSRLIVMLAGPTNWIHWEMQNIIRAQRLDHVLLLLPPGRAATDHKTSVARVERWDNIVRSLEETDYGPTLRALDVSDVLLVQFRAGRVIVYRSRSALVQDYDLALTLAMYETLSDPPPAVPPDDVALPDLAESSPEKPAVMTQAAPSVPTPPAPRFTPSVVEMSSHNAGRVALWFGLIGAIAGAAMTALLFVRSGYYPARPILSAALTGIAFAIATRFVLRSTWRDTTIMAGLGFLAVLACEQLIDPRNARSTQFFGYKMLVPLVVLAGGALVLKPLRHWMAWVLTLGASALSLGIGLALIGRGTLPLMLVLAFVFVLPVAVLFATIGYSLARDPTD